jgi:hypothetical protein
MTLVGAGLARLVQRNHDAHLPRVKSTSDQRRGSASRPLADVDPSLQVKAPVGCGE